MWRDGDWGAGAWFAMSLMMLLFWGGVIASVWWLVRGVGRTPQIDEDEFVRRRQVLHSTGPAA